jgi:hypothetical protein
MKTLDETLGQITSGVRGALDWVDYASICMAGDAGLDTFGATDPLLYKVEAAQFELKEGPAMIVAPSAPIVHSLDVASDPRWPRYALVAAELGIRTQVGALVPAASRPLTVLNLYSRSPRDLDSVSSSLARTFAEQAATTIECAARVQTLTEAVRSRYVISQAIGIAMERFGLDSTRAFQYLVKVSQSSQVKLRVVAAELVAQAEQRANADE